MTQFSELRQEDCGYRTMRVIDNDHTPSWKVYAKGRAVLDISSHKENKYLSITVEEICEADATRKRGSSKAAYFTLDVEHAEQVYKFLKEIFEP